jgi:hypothetical protein
MPNPVATRTCELPRGCGWYDSSWELERGLNVTEHLDPDAVAPLLPLSWWLAWAPERAVVAA